MSGTYHASRSKPDGWTALAVASLMADAPLLRENALQTNSWIRSAVTLISRILSMRPQRTVTRLWGDYSVDWNGCPGAVVDDVGSLGGHATHETGGSKQRFAAGLKRFQIGQ
eukprot:2473954-Rhodomonas_salina.1